MIIALLLGLAAATDGLRDLCPDRPGRLTPACIVDAGHLLIENGAVDVTHQAEGGETSDTLAIADTLLRLGLTSRLEVIAGWTPYLQQRTRRADGATTTRGVGDVAIGAKQSLVHPDGTAFSLAVQPFLVVPTAKAALGVGRAVVGVIVPATLALPADVQLGLSPEIDRIADQGGRGHHASYTLIGGITRRFGAVTAGAELAGVHDDDPTGRTTQATADLIAAYIPAARPNLQLDAGACLGLNRDTPAIEVSVGVSRRF